MFYLHLKSPKEKKIYYAKHLLFKPRCKFICAVHQWFKSGFSSYPMLPFDVQGYEFSVKYGLRKKDSLLHYKARLIMIIISGIGLLMLWSLNNANLSYALLQKVEDHLQPLSEIKVHSQIKTLSLSSEPVEIIPPSSQIKTLPLPSEPLEIIPPSSLWRHIQVQTGDNLSKIFERYKLNKSQLYYLSHLHKYSEKLLQLNVHQKLHIKSDYQGNVESLILELSPTHELHVYNQNQFFQAEVRPIGSQIDWIIHEGQIRTSFEQAAKQSGLSESMLTRFREIFQWEVDFNALQKGDSFKIVYEQRWFEGEIKDSDILAAGLIHRGEPYLAIQYTDLSGYTDYYTPWGLSLHKISLSIPVEFTRISSFFGERQHPILNMFHFHTGIDYAASRGTPVRAAGDGTIIFAGYKGGYGKTLILEHNSRLQTLYAHLSGIVDSLAPGETVFQGQVIGYVGQTGSATGPHLHYEVQLDALPINPLLANFPLTMPVPEKDRDDFLKHSKMILTRFENGKKPFSMLVALPTSKEELAMMPSF